MRSEASYVSMRQRSYCATAEKLPEVEVEAKGCLLLETQAWGTCEPHCVDRSGQSYTTKRPGCRLRKPRDSPLLWRGVIRLASTRAGRRPRGRGRKPGGGKGGFDPHVEGKVVGSHSYCAGGTGANLA